MKTEEKAISGVKGEVSQRCEKAEMRSPDYNHSPGARLDQSPDVACTLG